MGAPRGGRQPRRTQRPRCGVVRQGGQSTLGASPCALLAQASVDLAGRYPRRWTTPITSPSRSGWAPGRPQGLSDRHLGQQSPGCHNEPRGAVRQAGHPTWGATRTVTTQESPVPNSRATGGSDRGAPPRGSPPRSTATGRRRGATRPTTRLLTPGRLPPRRVQSAWTSAWRRGLRGPPHLSCDARATFSAGEPTPATAVQQEVRADGHAHMM